MWREFEEFGSKMELGSTVELGSKFKGFLKSLGSLGNNSLSPSLLPDLLTQY